MATLATDPTWQSAVGALEDMHLMYLEGGGGHSAIIDGTSIPGYVVVAGLDHDGEPDLTIYTKDQLLAWWDRACSFLVDHSFPDGGYEVRLGEAMAETEE